MRSWIIIIIIQLANLIQWYKDKANDQLYQVTCCILKDNPLAKIQSIVQQ